MKIGKVTWTWRLCGTTPIYPKRSKSISGIAMLIDENFLGLSIKSSREKHWPFITFWTNSETGSGIYCFDKNFWGPSIYKKRLWEVLKEKQKEAK
jgi:hypothetical protein